MNLIKLFSTLLMMSVILVSCSKTEMFQEDTATKATLIEAPETGVLYVNQDILKEIGGKFQEVPGKKTVYLKDEDFVKTMDKIAVERAKRPQCGRSSYTYDVWNGSASLSGGHNGSYANATASTTGTIDDKCQNVSSNQNGMFIDASLSANGQELAYDSEDFPCDSHTIEFPNLIYFADRVTWEICSRHEFYDGFENGQPINFITFKRVSKRIVVSSIE